MTAKRIPVMRPRLPRAEALRPYLEEIDRNGWYSNFGPLERRLEKRLAENFGQPAQGVACVANCTVGLTLALMSVARNRGGYCVMPSFTFVASAHAVLAAGLRPCFIDVDPDSWSISVEQACEAIADADGEVAAVMAVSPFGAPLDPATWDAFAEQNGVPVVIDAAAGFDSVAPGKAPAVVSMHATKVLPAGEGGFVLSQDTQRVRSIAARANFGFVEERRSEVAGLNGKLSEYSAAVALASLDEWPATRRRYREVADRYVRALGGIQNVALAPGFEDGWAGSTCNIRFDRPIATKAVAYLAEAGIDTRQWWGSGCHRERAFDGFPRAALPETDALACSVLGLPFHAALDEADIERISEAVAGAATLPATDG